MLTNMGGNNSRKLEGTFDQIVQEVIKEVTQAMRDHPKGAADKLTGEMARVIVEAPDVMSGVHALVDAFGAATAIMLVATTAAGGKGTEPEEGVEPLMRDVERAIRSALKVAKTSIRIERVEEIEDGDERATVH